MSLANITIAANKVLTELGHEAEPMNWWIWIFGPIDFRAIEKNDLI